MPSIIMHVKLVRTWHWVVFEDLQKAYKLIASHPASGSLRYSFEVGLPGLRSLQLKRHPYLIFYIEQADHIDVWRVLHAKMDIPAWLQNPGS